MRFIVLIVAVLSVVSAFKAPARLTLPTRAVRLNAVDAVDPNVLETASTLIPAFLRKGKTLL